MLVNFVIHCNIGVFFFFFVCLFLRINLWQSVYLTLLPCLLHMCIYTYTHSYIIAMFICTYLCLNMIPHIFLINNVFIYFWNNGLNLIYSLRIRILIRYKTISLTQCLAVPRKHNDIYRNIYFYMGDYKIL